MVLVDRSFVLSWSGRRLHITAISMSDDVTAALASRPIPDHLPSDNDLGDGLMIMTWTMLAISTLFVAARTVSKLWILRRFRLDDVFLLLTWVS